MGLWRRVAIQAFATLLLALAVSVALVGVVARNDFVPAMAGVAELVTRHLEHSRKQGELLAAHDALEDELPMVQIDLQPAGRNEQPSRGDFYAAAFTSHLGDGTLVTCRFPNPIVNPAVLAVVFAVVSLVVAIASIPLARGVALPLDHLTRAMKRFADGDMSARVGWTRRDELGDLGRTFDELATRLVTLRTTERELLAHISHELRHPIARMSAQLEIAAGTADVRRLSRCIDELRREVRDIDHVVHDLLTSARADVVEGQLFYDSSRERRPVDLHGLVSEAVDRQRHRNPDQPTELSLGDNAHLLGDHVLLSTALQNLLDNATKYGHQSEPVHVEAKRTAAGFEITVRDRGPGVPPAEVAELFHPFVRGKHGAAGYAAGLGLGLHLARRIILMHGGELSYERHADHTLFRIHLPLAALVDATLSRTET